MKTRFRFAGILVLTLWVMVNAKQRAAHASIHVLLAVVVDRNSPVSGLTLPELRRIFTGGGANDPSGQRFLPFNQSPRATDRVGFDRVVLGLSSEDVSQFWIDRKIRGLGGPPRSVDSVALLLRLITRLPGAITYARPSQLTKDVRAVPIDGKLPSDPGYPLAFTD